MAFEHYDGNFQEYLKHTAAAIAHERFKASVAHHNKNYKEASLHSAHANMMQEGLEGSLKHASNLLHELIGDFGILADYFPEAKDFLNKAVKTGEKYEHLAYDTSKLTRQLVDDYRIAQLKGRDRHTERRLGLPQVESADYSGKR